MQINQRLEIETYQLPEILKQFVVDVESFMQNELQVMNQPSSELQLAMQYVVMSGGKRIRPLLVRAAGLLNNADFVDLDSIVQIAAAIELIHCYSLVHDDLPAMDNDDLRRGLPTCHKKYGEAMAILVGDALQSLAFSILTRSGVHGNLAIQLKIANIIANCAGVNGMVGGQSLDILSTGNDVVAIFTHSMTTRNMSLKDLQHMHHLKTGKLIQAAILTGYLCGAKNFDDMYPEDTYRLLIDISESIGLLFQIVDDIIDVTSDTVTLGKTANKDMENNKATYVSILGLQAAQTMADNIYQDIIGKLVGIAKSDALIYLVDCIYNRKK
jgi:farnesyl diphosphate synthase